MSSSKNEDDDLPDGWVECHSKSNPGRMYFFNKKTGKSSWTKPQVEEKRRFTKKVQKEKSKKEETVKRDLKRKSDTQYDETTPKKRTSRVSETPTPEAKKQTKETPPSKPPASTKNSANKRLQLLRKRLSEETNKEEQSDPVKDKEQMKSPSKFRKDPQKVSPKAETPKSSKSNASDLKSPNLNESRCSTAQSPSSDSLQSIPSPSQFFAANKILSSMKAQLPEEYHHKMKAKDMFADIDQAICNQTPEYPSTKHPATPPQFSEASKIVSAIKSKLAFKSLTHFDSVNVKAYSSAKERLEALRTSLTKEAVAETKDCDSEFVNIEIKTAKQSPVENMEVEDCKQPKPSPQKSQYSSTNSKENDKDNVILVVDTNIFIHELDVIKNVLNSRINGYTEQPMLLVPWRVISELDRLKDNNNGNGAICKRARAAMDYLYQSLPENNRIKGQSLRDANSHIYPCEVPDDEILNCCLQQSERGKSVILLSNDKNLCSKAIINGVKCIGLNDLKGLLEDKRTESPDPDLQSSLKHYQATLYQLLANILENEMRAKYATLWQHVLFKAPPWTLRDVLQCLLKHWLAVFSEVFPRIEHLITELKNCVTSLEARGPNSLRSSEVDNFKELSLEVASKCQIIPEYMELAKKTVERLTQRPTAAVDEIAVIEAFETVWTVFSSYCAKLASGLGLSHDVEDKINSEEPLSVLTSKWNVFSSHIYDFTRCIQGILDTDEADPDFIEHLARLEAVFKSSLALISIDCSAVDADSLRLFCTKCRNMLQEAYVKFAHLTQLLDACRDTLKK